MPIENVIDVEESHMVEFADTCKIRVIDNDETYAIDEVSPFPRPLFVILSNKLKLSLVFLFVLRHRERSP